MAHPTQFYVKVATLSLVVRSHTILCPSCFVSFHLSQEGVGDVVLQVGGLMELFMIKTGFYEKCGILFCFPTPPFWR
jgi:hypothetical protein